MGKKQTQELCSEIMQLFPDPEWVKIFSWTYLNSAEKIFKKNKSILIQIFWLGASATAQVRMALMQTKGTATTDHDSHISVANTEIK